MTPMKIDTIGIKEDGILKKEHVDIDGEKKRENEERCGPHELIERFIRDDRKWGRVVKNMVALLDLRMKTRVKK